MTPTHPTPHPTPRLTPHPTLTRTFHRAGMMTRRVSPMRGGFILPMVVLLTFLMALVIAVILERQAAHALTVRRVAGQYDAHHTRRGLSEVIEAWVRSGQTKPMRERLGPDGLAMTIELAGGLSGRSQGPHTVALYLEDGQQSVLSDFTGLSGDLLLDAKLMFEAFRSISGNTRLQRTLGPVAVSAMSAPREMLIAAAMAAGTSGSPEAFAEAVLAQRDPGPLSAQAVQQAGSEAGYQGEALQRLIRLVAPETTLWRLRADVSAGGRLVDRYLGYAIVHGAGRRDRLSSGATRRGSILQLEQVLVD